MSTPTGIKSLFAGRLDDEEDEPAWLSTHEDRNQPDAGPSSDSDDPFDVAIVSPSKPEKRNAVAPPVDASAPSTSGRKAEPPPSKPPAIDATEAADTKSNATKPSGSGKASQPSTRVPLKNPASLKCVRLLVELPGDQEPAVDLTGDSGAVGRVSIQSQTGGKEVLLDLKGIMYKAALLPMACTACVVNVGPTEGKIEAFCNEFLQLEKSSAFGEGEVLEDGNVDDWILTDTYDMAAIGDREGGEAVPAKGKAKGKQSKAAMGVSSGRVVKVTGKKKPHAGGKGKGGKSKPKRK